MAQCTEMQIAELVKNTLFDGLGRHMKTPPEIDFMEKTDDLPCSSHCVSTSLYDEDKKEVKAKLSFIVMDANEHGIWKTITLSADVKSELAMLYYRIVNSFNDDELLVGRAIFVDHGDDNSYVKFELAVNTNTPAEYLMPTIEAFCSQVFGCVLDIARMDSKIADSIGTMLQQVIGTVEAEAHTKH